MRLNHYRYSRELGLLLQQQRLKLAVVESCTGGGLAHAITAVPNSSDWFERGLVTYSNLSKSELLGINPALIQQHGAVSAVIAKAMVEGLLARSEADIVLSITGIAGPTGGTPEKPVGTVWFGLGKRGELIETQHSIFSGGRQHIRACAVQLALQWLLKVAAP